MILDVGCGHWPRGDVNVDAIKTATHHRGRGDDSSNDWRLRSDQIPNLVIASIEWLPFRENSFDTVLSKDTIEHVKSPLLAIHEMVRISRNGIRIECPHRYAERMNTGHQGYGFSITWFDRAFKQAGAEVIYSTVTRWRSYPHHFLPIFQLPLWIEVRAVKKLPDLKS